MACRLSAAQGINGHLPESTRMRPFLAVGLTLALAHSLSAKPFPLSKGQQLDVRYESGFPLSCGTGFRPLRFDLSFRRNGKELWHNSFFEGRVESARLLSNGNLQLSVDSHSFQGVLCLDQHGNELWRRSSRRNYTYTPDPPPSRDLSYVTRLFENPSELKDFARLEAIWPLPNTHLSSDGLRLVGESDGVWEARTGRSMVAKEARAFVHPDGTARLVCRGHQCWIHHLGSGRRVLCTGVDGRTVWDPVFHPQRPLVAFQSEYQVRLVNMDNGQTVASWPRPALALAFNPYREELLLNERILIGLYDLKGRKVGEYPFRAADYLVAGFARDGSVRLGNRWSSIWLDDAGKILLEDIPVRRGFSISPDGQWTTKYFSLMKRDGTVLPVEPYAASPDGSLLVASRFGEANRVLEFPSLKPLLSFGHDGECSIDQCNRWLCQSDDTVTRIYSLRPSAEPRDPALWTGFELKEGKPVALTSKEFLAAKAASSTK